MFSEGGLAACRKSSDAICRTVVAFRAAVSPKVERIKPSAWQWEGSEGWIGLEGFLVFWLIEGQGIMVLEKDLQDFVGKGIMLTSTYRTFHVYLEKKN